MTACDVVSAILVVVYVIGVIVWIALGFVQMRREIDWPPFRRAKDEEPKGENHA